ncbi:MAG: hypothetical protein IKS29_09365 [Oscillospiraceae bacterium]|nr:hypothetical protein [Oscillospiraceae bacterium]
MKAKGSQMERAIQQAGGAEPAPHAVPPKYATAEQMERLIEAMGNIADPEVIGSAVDSWLDEHPEATTTVQDGSITAAKLAPAVAENVAAVPDLKSAINDKAPVIIDTASSSIASFPDGADSIPVKDLTVAIEPVQSGSGDPSPSNIRPISGWAGATVTRTGKNLLPSGMVHAAWANGVFYSHENASSRYLSSSGKIPVVGGETYTVSLVDDPTNAWTLSNVQFFADGVFDSDLVTGGQMTFTVPEGINEIALNGLMATNITNTSDVSSTDFQLELGSTATAYEPYQGATYDISFPSAAGTVYGGTLDVTTGVLTVDMAMVDMGALSWVYYPNHLRFGVKINGARYSGTSLGFDGACSIYAVSTANYVRMADKSVVIGCNFLGNTDAAMIVQDSAYTDAAVFKSAVSGQKLVYPLATPVTYQLTPTEVTTLLGTNNIWSDCGDSTVEYRADTKLYIDKKIAALAAAMN